MKILIFDAHSIHRRVYGTIELQDGNFIVEAEEGRDEVLARMLKDRAGTPADLPKLFGAEDGELFLDALVRQSRYGTGVRAEFVNE